MPIELSYADAEAILSRLHSIAEPKRVAFRARLKHFQRLGFPPGVNTGTGRRAIYTPASVTLLAIALELAQLGLSPDRAVHVLRRNQYPTAMALTMGCNSLLRDEPDARLAMFLYFDPTALSDLMIASPDEDGDYASATFFYGGIGIVRDNIATWTEDAGLRRIALINVTALIQEAVSGFTDNLALDFVAELGTWAAEASVRSDDESGELVE